MVDEIDARHFGGADQQVIGQVGGQGLGVLVVAHPFIKRVADAVGGATECLAIDQHRVDDAAAIMRQDIVQDGHAAGLDIHFHLGHRGAAGEGLAVEDHMFGRFQSRSHAARQRVARGAGHGMGQIAQGDLLIGDPPGRVLDVNLIAVDLKIFNRGVQHMGGDLERLFGNLAGGDMGGRARRYRKAAVRCADAQRGSRRVPGRHRDVFDVAAKLFGDDLGQHRLGALTDGRAAGIDMHLARGADTHGNLLEGAPSGALHEVAEADTDIPALRQSGLLARRKIFPACPFDAVLLALRVIAGIEHHREPAPGLERSGVGHGLGRDQIAAAHFGTVQPHFARHPVHQALDGEGGLGMPGAAHRRDRHLVGQGQFRIHVKCRDLIGPGQGFRRVLRQIDAARGIGAVFMDDGTS